MPETYQPPHVMTVEELDEKIAKIEAAEREAADKKRDPRVKRMAASALRWADRHRNQESDIDDNVSPYED